MASAGASIATAAGAACDSIPISEHFLPLPVTQLRLCVKIWHSDAATAGLASGDAATAAAAASASPTSSDQHAPSAAASQTRPLPRVRAHDTHLVMIHGWLDNAASWDCMCPTMIRAYAASPLAARLTAEARANAVATTATAGSVAAASSSSSAAASSSSSSASSLSPSRLVCYCIEMSGHGDSDHRSKGATYYPIEHALDMQQAVALLGFGTGPLDQPAEGAATRPASHGAPLQSPLLFVMGHSMGAATAAMLVALLGSRCAGLVMMDSTGPWAPATVLPDQPDPAVSKLAAALTEHAARGSTRKRAPKVYPRRSDIEDKYVRGNPFMEESSARTLARRAVRPLWYKEEQEQEEQGVARVRRQVDLGARRPPGHGWKEGWCFKHDNRLNSSALMQPLEPNTLTSFSEVSCPVLMFLASNTLRRSLYASGRRDPRVPTHWLLPETNPAFEGIVARRVAQFPRGCDVVRVEGDHHIHMDAPAERLAGQVVDFMQRAAAADTTTTTTTQQPRSKL